MASTTKPDVYMLIALKGRHGENTDVYVLPEVSAHEKFYLDLMENVHAEDLPTGGRPTSLLKGFLYISCALGMGSRDAFLDQVDSGFHNWDECNDAFGKWEKCNVDFARASAEYAGRIAGVYLINLCEYEKSRGFLF